MIDSYQLLQLVTFKHTQTHTQKYVTTIWIFWHVTPGKPKRQFDDTFSPGTILSSELLRIGRKNNVRWHLHKGSSIKELPQRI